MPVSGFRWQLLRSQTLLLRVLISASSALVGPLRVPYQSGLEESTDAAFQNRSPTSDRSHYTPHTSTGSHPVDPGAFGPLDLSVLCRYCLGIAPPPGTSPKEAARNPLRFTACFATFREPMKLEFVLINAA